MSNARDEIRSKHNRIAENWKIDCDVHSSLEIHHVGWTSDKIDQSQESLSDQFEQAWLKVAEHSFSGVLARALVDAIKHVHKDFKKQTCRQQSDHFIYSKPPLSVLFFSIIACSVLMALVFYYNDML